MPYIDKTNCQNEDGFMPILNRAAELQDEITEWRRHLHNNPELLFDVHQTAAFVEEKLKAFGCDEVVPGIGRTGVVGLIKGRNGGDGKAIGLRADMDALPIAEITGKPGRRKRMEKCMPVATMVIQPCYWVLQNISPKPAILRVQWLSFSSLPKKAVQAAMRWSKTA